MLARESLFTNKHPQIWVFTKDPDEKTTTYLEGALGERYAVDFISSEDLVNKVNDRIDNYVRKLTLPPRHTWHWIVVAASVVALLIGWCIGHSFAPHVSKPDSSSISMQDSSNQKMLLIAGGGSIANFIEETRRDSIPSLADYPNGFFVHLPTKSAWKMLEEEVVSLQDTRRYYPICISATAATEEDFCSGHIKQQMYIDSAIIVSCELGKDSLAVYIPKDCNFLKEHPDCEQSHHISVNTLKKLIESKSMNVYSTSKESGTRAGYCKILKYHDDSLDKYVAGQFSESTHLSDIKIGDNGYLLLGSQYYGMTEIQDEAIRLTVKSDYVKPMLLYFMAYRDRLGNTYKIPEETIRFLRKLGLTSFIEDCVSKDGIIKLRTRDKVIYVYGEDCFIK